MAKYNKETVKRISDLVSSDSYIVSEICRLAGISERTFYEWKSKNAVFADVLKKASDKFDELCITEAKKSLLKIAKGYDITETKTIYTDMGGQPAIKEQTETTKHIQPLLGANIFILTNKDPENWKNRQNVNQDTSVTLTGSIPIEEWIKERIK
jgi:hypothetical protein